MADWKRYLYGKNAVRVLYENNQGVVRSDYFKKKLIGKTESVCIDGKNICLGLPEEGHVRFDHNRIPFYKAHELKNKTSAWELVKFKESELSSQEVDALLESKVLIDVLKMSGGLDLKMILIIGGVVVIAVALYMAFGNPPTETVNNSTQVMQVIR